MKKDILGVIAFIALFIIACLIFYKPKHKLVVTVPKLEKKTHYVTGVIVDASMNVVSIKTEKGSIYTFSLAEVDHNNIDGLALDNKVTITYDGILDTSKSFQKGIVKKMILEDKKIITYPEEWNDNGIFSAYYKEAYNKLKTMTLDEKIGQLLLVRVPADKKIETINQYHLGGYILFGRDTKDKSKDELISEINSYQSASKIPIIIATDEEGGIVNRVSTNSALAPKPFASSQELYEEGGFDLISKDTKEKSKILSNLGINMNLAPVADVSTAEDDYIYSRSFGRNANDTADYIKTVIEASKDTKVNYTLKHFPGYGNNIDTHTGIASDNRSYDNFLKNDFLPFLSGVQSGVKTILVSHNIVKSMDADNPASLSKNVHNILREQLGFTGLIMTDDLAMDAISKYSDGSASVKAILSGNDLIIITDYEKAFSDIKAGLNNNVITEGMINHLAFRVLAYKYSVGLL